MRRMTSLVVVFALLLTFAVPPRPAQATISVYDVVNWIENALQVLQQAYEIYQRYMQLYNDYQRYATMLKNLDDFDELYFRELAGLAANVNEIMRQGESLGHTLSEIDSEFTETFPGYESVLTENWTEIFAGRNRRALDTLRYGLNALHAAAEDSVASQEILEDLKEHAEDAEGNLEALEASNELLHHQSGQLGKIGQQILVQTNLQAVYWAYQLDQEASTRATTAEWIANGVGEVPPYEGLTGVHGVPRDWPWPCFGCSQSQQRTRR